MALLPGDKANFETLRRASRDGNLCLMECTLQNNGEYTAVICAVQREDDGACTMVPLAQMFSGNPYDILQPPEGGE